MTQRGGPEGASALVELALLCERQTANKPANEGAKESLCHEGMECAGKGRGGDEKDWMGR